MILSIKLDLSLIPSVTLQLVNVALIAIAQEVAELLKQSYPVQADENDSIEN